MCGWSCLSVFVDPGSQGIISAKALLIGLSTWADHSLEFKRQLAWMCLFHLLKPMYLFLYLFTWLAWVFVAAPGLSPVVANGGVEGLLSIAEYGLLIAVVSLVAEHGFQGTWAQQLPRRGLTAPWHVGSFQIRNWTGVPCISRWILNHWTTRKSLHHFLTVE